MSIIKEEKRTIIIFLIEISIPLIVFVIIPMSIYLYGRHLYAGTVLDATHWKITLPSTDEMKKVLKEHAEYGPHGDGLRHSIYIVDRNKIKLKFRIDLSTDIEDICLQYCDELETQEKYIPDFSQEYRWRKFEEYQNTLILLYFVDTQELHIFEDIL